MRKLLPMYALATDSETKGAPTAMMERSLIAPTWTYVDFYVELVGKCQECD
uniref:Uncharacterized protein n=1 Tax=Anopheles atroparvus TaxID=41427 RepID=A0AAG5DNV7_ANOAO